jgi:hypothetical protein
VILATFANVYHDVRKLFIVHVSNIVPPLPAGRFQIVKVFIGREMFALPRSVIVTPEAALPQLFPYEIV